MNNSKADTLEHIKRVNELLIDFAIQLLIRAQIHDTSKLYGIEKRFLDQNVVKLSETLYEKGYLDKVRNESVQEEVSLDQFLEAHYGANPHHPEHYPNGLEDMSLIDIVEMLCDWKAAGERHKDGSFAQSLFVNVGRFGIPPKLEKIFRNTGKKLAWI